MKLGLFFNVVLLLIRTLFFISVAVLGSNWLKEKSTAGMTTFYELFSLLIYLSIKGEFTNMLMNLKMYKLVR